SGVELTGVGFVDHSDGFASGWVVNDPQGCNSTAASAHCRVRLYRSSDGGASWIPIFDHADLGAVSIVDFRTVFAVAAVAGCSGYPDSCGSDLWRTADGGATWSVVSRTATPIWDVRFADAREGYLSRLDGFGLAGTGVIAHTA